MSRSGSRSGRSPRVSGAALFFLAVLLAGPALALLQLEPAFLPWLAAGLAGISLLTAWLYRTDKRAAEIGGARVPEVVLHGCEFLGGWPAAFLAQRFWRHKTAKLSYQVGFWVIVALHEFLAADRLLGGRLGRQLWDGVSRGLGVG